MLEETISDGKPLELPNKGTIDKIFKFKLIEIRGYSEQITIFSIKQPDSIFS